VGPIGSTVVGPLTDLAWLRSPKARLNFRRSTVVWIVALTIEAWPIVRAITAFAQEQGLQHEVVDGQFWVLRKPAKRS
jgi:hypothetical protein